MHLETRVERAERVISEANQYIQANKVQAERKANAEFWKHMNEIPFCLNLFYTRLRCKIYEKRVKV